MAGSVLRKPGLIVPLALVVIAGVVAAVVISHKRAESNKADTYRPPPLAFDGPSDELKATVVVPTLDTPMPEGKNVIWCASFQIAWNEFRDDVIGEPVKITGAQEIADRLNASAITSDVLDAGDYYAKAGFVKDGAVERIRTDMAAQFPSVPMPEFDVDDPDLVAVMYSYLSARAKFSFRFCENEDRFLFGSVPVTSFGVRRFAPGASDIVREQVGVLYYSGDPYDHTRPEDEFAVDPCTLTDPYQIILARIAPKADLAATLADLDEKISGNQASSLLEGETLLVPNLHWKVTHRFMELENRKLGNDGHTWRWLEELQQRTEFLLDRSGAELRSEARGIEEESPRGDREFLFNRPFLIVMKKRGAERPFFVMWVDNTELLCKP